MKHLPTLIGSAVCGALCFAIWPEMWKTYGIMGGWITATIVISICWYMNHWLGIIWNPDGKLWIDQGWAVGGAGVAWALVRFHNPATGMLAHFKAAVPTLVLCLIGGALGGFAAYVVKKKHPTFAPKNAEEEEA